MLLKKWKCVSLHHILYCIIALWMTLITLCHIVFTLLLSLLSSLLLLLIIWILYDENEKQEFEEEKIKKKIAKCQPTLINFCSCSRHLGHSSFYSVLPTFPKAWIGPRKTMPFLYDVTKNMNKSLYKQQPRVIFFSPHNIQSPCMFPVQWCCCRYYAVFN